jgi:hypothetical protein
MPTVASVWVFELAVLLFGVVLGATALGVSSATGFGTSRMT